MKTRTIKAAIVLAWLVLSGWFIRYEAFPAFFTNTLGGYRDLFAHGELFMDSWMKILFHEHPIGTSETQVEVVDDDPLEHYRITSRTMLRMNLMGEQQDVNVLTSGGLDVLYHLQKFTFGMSSRRYGIRIEGERKRGDTFMLKIHSDAGEQRAELDIPDDVILYSPATEMAMGRMKPGDTLRVRTLDPSSLSIADMIVHALRRERRDVLGKPTDTVVLATEMHGMELTSWVDAEGKVVRQETPFGWIMEACSSEEAAKLKIDTKATGDMLSGMAVGVKGVTGDLRGSDTLRVKLNGLSADQFRLANNRQAVEETGRNFIVVSLRRATWPASGAAVPLSASDLTNFLASTMFVQADAPAIVARAKQIVEGKATARDQARAIYDWVYRNVRKEITVSLPSAVDVLDQMEGDCNEHTYLFTALARAVGLPTQMRIGLLYKDGKFYYHAWPSVYVGDWVEMDPTIGEELADATHIGLLEGELANQVRLLEVVGRLEVEVLGEGETISSTSTSTRTTTRTNDRHD